MVNMFSRTNYLILKQEPVSAYLRFPCLLLLATYAQWATHQLPFLSQKWLLELRVPALIPHSRHELGIYW